MPLTAAARSTDVPGGTLTATPSISRRTGFNEAIGWMAGVP